MKEEFIKKLNNKEYISKYLYLKVQKEIPSLIPNNFNLDTYNNEVLASDQIKYKDYFQNMYNNIDPNIHLDEDQIKAILTDEEYSLIIAGAGTGKTTTMASKIKYLVDIKKIPPNEILAISFTKKATEELQKRIVVDFNIPAEVTTFHSLGLMYIREIFKPHKCYVVDKNIRNSIFLEYFKENIFPYKNKVKELLELFTTSTVKKIWLFGDYFQRNYQKYNTFQEYFQNYKIDRLKEIPDLDKWLEDRINKDINDSEVIYTIRGEMVKSKGEAIIANFLYINSIDYEYEKVYEKLMPDNKTYKPDFTLNLGGEEVYVEYFGLSNYKDDELNRYNKIRKIKEDYHARHHTKFIKIDYQRGENLENTLREELTKMGFILKKKTNIEIYNRILDNNEVSQLFPFRDFLYSVIDGIKSSKNRKDYSKLAVKYINTLTSLEETEMCQKQYTYINDFYLYYQKKLYGSENYGFDFSDMIYYSNLYINNIGTNTNLKFQYIIIDEYQDISEDRYILAKNVSTVNTAKVVAVGDDWQSIFSFAGSKIEYTYNFLSYFPTAKILKISKAYRNSRQLIKYSSDFIMKNTDQISKQLLSTKENPSPIKFVFFEEGKEYQKLKELILAIHKNNKNSHILILGRTNKIIDTMYEEPELIDDMETKVKYQGYDDIDIDGMTIHKSKGLTSDEVIIIGLDSRFPKPYYGDFWLKEIYKNNWYEEKIPFAEERRLFYVALTRTKNNVYLLVNKDADNRSPFINEIYNIMINNKKSI